MHSLRRFLTLSAFLILLSVPAGAVPSLVVDLSSAQIKITTGFTGAHLLLFGAVERKGDIVVVVRGPLQEEIVRRKERIGGIWVNRDAVTFGAVPGYNFVASSRPLNQIATEETLRRLQIGSDRLALRSVGAPPKVLASTFRKGLISLKQEKSLFSVKPDSVTILSGKLFRADLTFPANVPTGYYTAEIYLFDSGRPVSISRKRLAVHKVGLGAAIYNYAHDHAALYGIVAVLIALFAGWLGGVIFRKA